jgi:hypothetical protein
MALSPSKENGTAGPSFIAVAAKPCAAFALKSPSAAAAFSTDLRSMAFVI